MRIDSWTLVVALFLATSSSGCGPCDHPIDIDADAADTVDDIDTGAGGSVDDPEEDGFYLHPNGITVLCPDVPVGAEGLVDGIAYTKRNREALITLGSLAQESLVTACTSGITDMSFGDAGVSIFIAGGPFNQDISSWDTSNVINMRGMLVGAATFNQDISSWDTSNVIDMSDMFSNARSFNQDISSWDTGSATDMSGAFAGAASFNQNLSRWCVEQIASVPDDFDLGADSWILPRPVWGTCPSR